LQSLLNAGGGFAGVLITVDPSSLPDRSTLSGDTDFGVNTFSANSNDPVMIVVNGATATPEPSTWAMALVGVFLAFAGYIGRRDRERR